MIKCHKTPDLNLKLRCQNIANPQDRGKWLTHFYTLLKSVAIVLLNLFSCFGKHVPVLFVQNEGTLFSCSIRLDVTDIDLCVVIMSVLTKENVICLPLFAE